MAAKRIKFELEEKPEGMNFVYLNSNLGDVFNCVGYFIGPDNTPYEGSDYYFEVKFPLEYPFVGPSITFISKIFHPSISKSGRVNLRILNNDWSPKFRIYEILKIIYELLINIDGDYKDNQEASELYNTDKVHFYRLAKEIR